MHIGLICTDLYWGSFKYDVDQSETRRFSETDKVLASGIDALLLFVYFL